MKMEDHVEKKPRVRLERLPLIALGIASLVCGVWGGLIRLPMTLPNERK